MESETNNGWYVDHEMDQKFELESIDNIQGMLSQGKDFPEYVNGYQINTEDDNRRRTSIRGMPPFLKLQAYNWLDNHPAKLEYQYHVELYCLSYGYQYIQKYNPLKEIQKVKSLKYDSVDGLGEVGDSLFIGNPRLKIGDKTYSFEIHRWTHSFFSKLSKKTATSFTDLVILSFALAVARGGAWVREDNRKKAVFMLKLYGYDLDAKRHLFEHDL